MLAEISSSLRLPKALRSRCLDSGRSLDLSCALHKRDQSSSMLSSILPGKLYTMWGICTFHIWTFLSTRQPHGMRVSRKVQAPVWLASHARLYSCLPCFQKSAKSADGSHLTKTVKVLGTGPWDRGNFDVPPGVLTLYWSLSGNKLHTPFGINVTVSSCSIRRARDASAMPHLIRHIFSCTTPSVVPIPLPFSTSHIPSTFVLSCFTRATLTSANKSKCSSALHSSSPSSLLCSLLSLRAALVRFCLLHFRFLNGS